MIAFTIYFVRTMFITLGKPCLKYRTTIPNYFLRRSSNEKQNGHSSGCS